MTVIADVVAAAVAAVTDATVDVGEGIFLPESVSLSLNVILHFSFEKN